MFLNYIKTGSIELLKDENDNINDYLDGIFSTVVYKDIMLRNIVNDKLLLECVIKFIFDNIGSPISTKKISDKYKYF